jgi:hypothetical protein
MIDRAKLITHIEKLRSELKKTERKLRVVDLGAMEKRTGVARRFYNVRPSTAIKKVLREKGALTQAEITKELIDGGNTMGKKRDANRPNNIRISFEMQMKTGALKQVGQLIGLPGWSKDKFKR